MSFIEIGAEPKAVFIQTEKEWIKSDRQSANTWVHNDIGVALENNTGGFDLYLTAQTTPVKRVLIRWKHCGDTGIRVLGDHWERSYGDLEWRGIIPERIMPWYFLTNDGVYTNGYGVKTGANAMCFWQMSANDVTLCMDVRCGGSGVLLSGKNLMMATFISRKGNEGESPFRAAKAFCTAMCDNPVLPSCPIYGGNNWYYTYGISNESQIIEDSKRVSGWADENENRPFMVVDACWQEIFLRDFTFSGGPWYRGNSRFPDMGALAGKMKELEVRPGIWYRPLATLENLPDEWKLNRDRFKNEYQGEILDPSVPEALEHIEKDVSRFLKWGYELIKHDFSSWDIFGRWGFDMKGQITDNGWSFADSSKTTAEVLKELYKAIYRQGSNAVIIGCNTISHLSAGLVHIQRTGDDTSGLEWEVTRRMGVNTLAFRMPQNGTFYASDADCVGLTEKIPWGLNKQWLELLSQSGTPLFVSASPSALGDEQNKAIREAFEVASKHIPDGEPLDWMETICPSKWVLNGRTVRFEWEDANGVPKL